MALTLWEDRALLESNPSAQTGFCRGYGGGYLIYPSPFLSPLPCILEENQSDKLLGRNPKIFIYPALIVNGHRNEWQTVKCIFSILL